ncbi:hypothetical protein [Paracoccus aestuariivivens]|uniref:Uncharacterized protein n=1 Tax=Paracoccus aestuariivivens TaxID=1820333 RepID=A0A6L6J526_9RHOB|nr:hypothetical protein [Paracoccus aestuariivivens]MTH76335.1 hypothetical protein [Paracoccus aestuariivivens]
MIDRKHSNTLRAPLSRAGHCLDDMPECAHDPDGRLPLIGLLATATLVVLAVVAVWLAFVATDWSALLDLTSHATKREA